MYTGTGFQKGFPIAQVFNEIHAAGGGMRKFWTSLDGYVARTMAYTTARCWGFLYFYDWFNPDPRRTGKDGLIFAGLIGGAIAGVVTNPVELVFTRMQVDEIYPDSYRRNYKSFFDGLMRASEERVLMRGAVANAVKIAAIASSMTHVNDWCKENSYFFLGPHWINRVWATAAATAVGTFVALPFDAVKTRMHTMRPLPDGRMPYNSSFDCFRKMFKYEGNPKHHSNPGSFYAGGQAFYFRLFAICYLS